MPQTVVIVGGGFAGVECARRLERLLPASTQIVLFNEQNYTIFTPLLAEVAGSSISPLHVVWTIRVMLRRTICYTAQIDRLDLAGRRVEYRLVQGRAAFQTYDHLVLAGGSVVHTDAITGAAAHALPLKTLGDALALRNHVIRQLEWAEVEPDRDRRRLLLSFVVLGGGFSGVEVAGEIFDLLREAIKYYPSISPGDMRVLLLQGSDRILPELPESLSRYAHDRMSEHGIEIRTQARAQAITESSIVLADGTTFRAGTVIATIGTATNPLFTDAGLELVRGRLRTEADMSIAGHPGVWALGDCAAVPNAYDGQISPPLAQFAVRQGRQLAANIDRAMRNQPTRPFHYRMLGMFAAIGHRQAVGRVLGVTFAGFFAWFLWRGLYLSKMPTLARRVQIAFDWAWDLLFPRDICQLSRRETTRAPRAHFEAGDEIFRQGDPADRFYIIERGSVGVYVDDLPDPVLRLGSGEFFGERELFREGARRFTVKADSSLDVLTIGYGSFRDYLEHMQSLRTSLHDRITRLEALERLRELVREHPRLAQVQAWQAMVSPAPVLDLHSRFDEAIAHFHQELRSACVVVDDEGRACGMCSVTDLHNALCALRPLDTPISDIMSKPVVTIGETQSVSEAMTTFMLRPIKRLVVISQDDAARPLGLLTPFDILYHYTADQSAAGAQGVPAG
jgi:NADH dehydrogenase